MSAPSPHSSQGIGNAAAAASGTMRQFIVRQPHQTLVYTSRGTVGTGSFSVVYKCTEEVRPAGAALRLDDTARTDVSNASSTGSRQQQQPEGRTVALKAMTQVASSSPSSQGGTQPLRTAAAARPSFTTSHARLGGTGSGTTTPPQPPMGGRSRAGSALSHTSSTTGSVSHSRGVPSDTPQTAAPASAAVPSPAGEEDAVQTPTTAGGTGGGEAAVPPLDGGDPNTLEARLLQRVNPHPNVLEYYRHFDVEGHQFLVTEYLPGGSLLRLMRNEPTTRNGFPDHVAAGYIGQVATAVAHLHARGVLHRDIKAANVFLSESGKTAKLGDFGSAWKQPEDAPWPSLAAYTPCGGSAGSAGSGSPALPPAGQALEGSVLWMAPEAMLSNIVHPCIDVWGLGCLAIELLTGTPPFSRFSSKAAVLFYVSQLTEDPVAEWEHLRLSPNAVSFISSCLRVNPSLRPSAEDLLAHPWVSRFVPIPDDLPFDAAAAPAAPNSSSSLSRTRGGVAASVGARSEPPSTPATTPGATDLDASMDAAPPRRTLQSVRHPTRDGASSADLTVDRTAEARRVAVLRTLDAACNPSNPTAMAGWLFGSDDLGPFVLTRDSATGRLILPTSMGRLAAESVGQAVNEVAAAVNLARVVANRTGLASRPQPNTQEARELAEARHAACAVIRALGSAVGVWHGHIAEVAHRSRTAAATAFDHVVAEVSTYETQMLAASPIDGAERSVALCWVVLEALTHSAFWQACDLRVLFADCPALTRAGGRVMPSPTRNEEADTLDTGDETTDSAAFMNSTTSSRLDPRPPVMNTGAPLGATAAAAQTTSVSSVQDLILASPLSPADLSPGSLEELFDETARCVLHLYSASLFALGNPSVGHLAQRMAEAAAGSSWAGPLLLQYGPTCEVALPSLTLAVGLDRRFRGLPSHSDAVCAATLAPLGPRYLEAAYTLPDGVDVPQRPSADAGAATGGGASNPFCVLPLGAASVASLADTRSPLAMQLPSSLRHDVFAYVTQLDYVVRRTPNVRPILTSALRLFAELLSCVGSKDDLRRLIGSASATAVLNPANSGDDQDLRLSARLCLVLSALLDGEYAWATFTADPYVNCVHDQHAPYPLKAACAVALVPMVHDMLQSTLDAAKTRVLAAVKAREPLPGGVVLRDHSDEAVSEAALKLNAWLTPHAARGSFNPAAIATILQQPPPRVETPDPVLGAVLEMAQLSPALAEVLADDPALFREVRDRLSKAAQRPCRTTQSLVLSLLRVLFVHSRNPWEFVDSQWMCEDLVKIASDPGSSKHLTVSACELLNAFANVAVF